LILGIVFQLGILGGRIGWRLKGRGRRLCPWEQLFSLLVDHEILSTNSDKATFDRRGQ
jgi:hypothetical protein